MWNCGHLSRRGGPGFPRPGGWPLQETEKELCPGYLTRLPQVIETVRLLSWKKTGQLAIRLEGTEPTGLLMDSLDILEAAIGDVESYMLEQT